MDAAQVKKVAKWPNRQEQIAMLLGQILSPGSTLSGQLVGPARKIAGQVKKMIEDREEGSTPDAQEAVATEGASE
jgi:large subunit ribosomal protein L10